MTTRVVLGVAQHMHNIAAGTGRLLRSCATFYDLRGGGIAPCQGLFDKATCTQDVEERPLVRIPLAHLIRGKFGPFGQHTGNITRGSADPSSPAEEHLCSSSAHAYERGHGHAE